MVVEPSGALQICNTVVSPHDLSLNFGDGFGDGSVTVLESIPFMRQSQSIPPKVPKPLEITEALSYSVAKYRN